MNSIANRFEYGAKIALFVLAAALPLWFVPSPSVGIELGREISFGVLIVVSAMLWLASGLSSGEIRYARSPLLWAGIAVAAVFGVSAFFSKAPLVSLLFTDAAGEKFFSVLALVILAVLAGSVLRRREDAGTLLFILIFSGAVSALMTLAQFTFGISIFKYLNVSTAADANVVGTANGISLFYAALFAMAAGVALSRAASQWNKWVRWALGGAGALFLTNILLINFLTAWIALLGATVLLFGLMTIQNRMAGQEQGGGLRRQDWRYWTALAMVAVCIAMIMARAPLITAAPLTPEVSPSFSATLSIAGSVFKEGARQVFFGSGPGTFGMDWARYKDVSLNQTIFWGVAFPQGNSWASTLLTTTGILGAAAFAAYAAGGLLLFLRALLSPDHGRGSRSASARADMPHLEDPVATAVLLGNAVAVIAAFMYPSAFSLALVLFFTSGLLAFLLSRPAEGVTAAAGASMRGDADAFVQNGADDGLEAWDAASGEEVVPTAVGMTSSTGSAEGLADLHESSDSVPARGFWEFEERIVRFQTPWAVFIFSLSVIFLLALGAGALYMEVSRGRAARAAGAGVQAANRGSLDKAIADLERATRLEDNNFRTHQFLAAVRTEKIRAVIRRASAGETVTEEFQSAVSAAVQSSQRAVALHPADAGVWRTQGALYETIIPFVPGAERLAFSSYQKAVELDPANPSIYVDWGRSGLVFTDRIQAAIAGAKDEKERATLEGAHKSNLTQIAQIFQKAADLKPDYAPAHFLLAQTQIRLGNIDLAIQSVENAKLSAPFDIGVAFQLGLLYYQKQDLDKAEMEFARAVSLNENYSNARYFLGLIYDRKGDKEKAKAEFAKIAALNPDNREVKQILENLAQGRAALAGIVPPAPPPEKRKEAPVKETTR